MMKTLIEYDYRPVDYVTFIIYYQSFKNDSTELFLLFILQYYIVTVHIQFIRIRFSVYGTSVSLR